MDTKPNQQNRCEISNLIQMLEFYLIYPGKKQIPLAFIYYANDVGMDNRDAIHQAGLDNDAELINLDKKAIKLAVTKYRANYKEEEQQGKPLESWWWYLDKIYDRTYPAELLPPHLRDIYLNPKPKIVKEHKQKDLPFE